jgi:hypothetical protein
MAAQLAFRMLDSVKSNTGGMQRHLKIYEDFRRLMDQYTLSDKMTIGYDFGALFEVEINEEGG